MGSMNDSPSPLPEGTIIDGFTPDATLAWLVAYAGPCGDPECERDNKPDGHSRIYLIPMIGWLHAIKEKGFGDEEVQLRPAIMSSGGSVVDYMNVADVFRFIAVLRADDNTIEVAKQLYAERGGDLGALVIEKATAIAN